VTARLRAAGGLAGALLALAACSGDDSGAASPGGSGSGGGSGGSATASGTTTCEWGAGSTANPYLIEVDTPPDEVPTEGTTDLVVTTNLGELRLTLDQSATPCAAASLAHLAQAGFFDDSPCHREVDSPGLQVLQCGDPTGTGSGGPGYQFGEENLPADGQNNYPAGTVAMANAGAGTNGSQFFLVYEDTTLPPNYTVFGTITEGLDVVTKVAEAGVEGGGEDGKPATPVTIERVSIGKA
jgi:peptidyl-prolyl cis-trans isomerase B (cyclophilin B)